MLRHPSELAGQVAAWPRPIRLALPVLLGAAAALGHEGWGLGPWPVWLALVTGLLALPMAMRRAVRFGWAMGLGYFVVTLRWIVEPFLVDPLRHGWMAPFAIVLLAGGLALFWAVAFGLARWLSGQGPVVMLWLPVTLTAAELLRAHLFTGFPWGLLSYTLIGGVGDVWLAWAGPHGTGLLLTGVAGVTAYCLFRGWTLIWPGLVAVLFTTIGVQALTPRAPGPASDATLRIVQPNAPQHQKWDPEWMPFFFDRALGLTRGEAAADVVIWPETSVPARLGYAEPWLEQMTLAASGAPVVAGIQRAEAGAYYNSLVVLDGASGLAALYDKAHLVPFGEYVPFAHLLRPLGFGPLVDQVAGFSPGKSSGLLQIDGLGLARVLICYEGIFPEEITGEGDPRPDLLLIITNDAWFGTGPGPRQHLQQAQARAIEQGLPVVRAANTGVSAVIDARGRITAALPLNTSGALDARLPGALPPTLYVRMGDWPMTVVLLLVLVGGASLRRRFAVDADQAHL